MSDDDEDHVVHLVNVIMRVLAGQPMEIACSALALAVATQVINLTTNAPERDETADNMRAHVGQILADPELVAWIQGSTTPIHLGSQRWH